MFKGHAIKTTGWRGSRNVWIEAAYAALLDGGIDAVKVLPLAEGLGLSRTSFYGHFTDREDLLKALVELWENRNTSSLISQTEAYAETITEAMFNLFDCWLDPERFDAKLEFAVRNWAHTDTELARKLADADARRLTALKAMFLRFGYADDLADARANTIYLTQVGYIAMKTEEPAAARIKRMAAYAETFTGERASEADLARFLSRYTKYLNC